jgi:hypothetical protein
VVPSYLDKRKKAQEHHYAGLWMIRCTSLLSFQAAETTPILDSFGFIELDPRHAIVSWYSSHENDENGKAITAIYLADLELAE